MKQFFKFFTASCLGTIAALCLIVLIFSLVGLISGSGSNKIESGTILELDFNKAIPEKSNNVVKGEYDFDSEEYMGLRELKRTIAHAAADKNIKGIVLKTKSTQLAPSTLSDVQDALKKFKESEKFIYSYSDYYSQSAYYLASIADSIFLNPNGLVELKGYGTLLPFFKPMMDRWGLKFDIYYAGKFKSATEPFRRTEMSEPNKVQTREFLDDLYDMFADNISSNRDISKSDLNSIINNFEGRTAKKSLSNKLIDVIAYHNEFTAFLKDKMNIEKKKQLTTISLEDYSSKINLKIPKGKGKIAVIYAEGNIVYNNGSSGQVDDTRYLKVFDKIKRNDKIDAVVIRVNSGGGSALTSDIIWNEIEELKADSIPVVTSMGDYAASGGYYIACNSDKIVASPNSLTGSIGVFSMMPNVKKFMNEKVGIVFDTVKTHDLALMNNMVYDPNQRENIAMQEGTDEIYAQFLGRVAEGRNMSVEEVDKIAQGRIWMGRKAKEIGLVDELGNLDDALEIAAELAGIETYKITEYPKIKENPFKELFKALEDSQASISPKKLVSPKTRKFLDTALEIEQLMQTEGPQAKMPYQIIVD